MGWFNHQLDNFFPGWQNCILLQFSSVTKQIHWIHTRFLFSEFFRFQSSTKDFRNLSFSTSKNYSLPTPGFSKTPGESSSHHPWMYLPFVQTSNRQEKFDGTCLDSPLATAAAPHQPILSEHLEADFFFEQKNHGESKGYPLPKGPTVTKP